MGMHTGSARSWSVRQSQFFNDLKQGCKANEFSYAIMVCLYKKIDRLSQAIEILKEIGQELNYNSQVHDESCLLTIYMN